MCIISWSIEVLGLNSKSWLNWQIPILTEGEHTNARIVNMNISNINQYLKKGIAVLPGFQGISKDGEITTIGRGGSDATAVVVAKMFNADAYEIYTDVDGVFLQTQTKFLLQKKLIKFLMMKCLNYHQ